jgi:hypothetical protein
MVWSVSAAEFSPRCYSVGFALSSTACDPLVRLEYMANVLEGGLKQTWRFTKIEELNGLGLTKLSICHEIGT